jgi:glycosyltransferase involved in cell wall biosynthesis
MRRSIVVAGAFPPPLHGQSKNTRIIATDLARLTRVIEADLSPGRFGRTLGYHLCRTAKVALACLKVARNGFREQPCLYIPADGGFGVAYTVVLVLIARLFRYSIFIHHRSFAAIDRYSILMAMLVAGAGKDTCHIFLCDNMKQRFFVRYPGIAHALVSSNARHTPVQPIRPNPSAFVRIGLISNLGREKGLYHFLNVARACAESGLPIKAVLAGPVASEEDRRAINDAVAELGDRISYLGPVYGEEKTRFYLGLDVFVFPTEYENEAQPNVLFEAMSFGLAIVTLGRGCIAEDVDPACGLVIDHCSDFVVPATKRLADWCHDRQSLDNAKAAAVKRISILNSTAITDYEILLSAIVGQSDPLFQI